MVTTSRYEGVGPPVGMHAHATIGLDARGVGG